MFSNGFGRFMGVLSQNPDSLDISAQAFASVAPDLALGRVTVRLPAAVGEPGHDGCGAGAGTAMETRTLFEAPDSSKDPGVTLEYASGTADALLFQAYPRAGTVWDEDGVLHVRSLLEMFAIHLERQLMRLSMNRLRWTNLLTGLPNAAGFLSRLNDCRERGILTGFNAYLFDLRSFTLINRQFGQSEGDEVLRRCAQVFSGFADQPGECIGHLGGDSFIGLIRKERSDSFLHLLNKVTTYAELNGQRLPVQLNATAGCLSLDDDTIPTDQIISRCSLALNTAKNVLHQPYTFATEEMSERIIRDRAISAMFPTALAQGEFVVYYQPKVDIERFLLVGGEALVRWYHDGRIISPAEFIPVLEESGEITELDLFVHDRVCQDLRRWQDMGIDIVPISVNFSRKDLAREDLPDQILRIIQKHGLDKKYLEAELTETTNVREQKELTHFMERMQKLGVSLAIDDFGTGYSSLNILRDFPVDVLKIDKSFLDVSVSARNDEIVLQNIIGMAKQLNMQIITEGVETVDQMNFLLDMGCHIVQGFLFGRPMPAEEFEKVLRRKRYDPPRIAAAKGS